MKKISNNILAFALIFNLTFALSACAVQTEGEESSEEESTTSSTTTATTTTTTTTQVTEPEPEYAINYLTGEENLPFGMENKRPLAFMVNNAIASLPQYGLETADIIYEMPVEGGITRLLVMYANHDNVVRVGSIRSARHNFMDIAAPYNAVYIHMGRSVIADKEIKARGLDSIDANARLYAVEQDKSLLSYKGSEHTYFVTKSSLSTALSKTGISLDNTNSPAFLFAAEGENVATGEVCSRIDIPFSRYTNSYFDYEAVNGVYKKGEFGEAQIDAASGRQVSVKNVIVLFTSVETIKGYNNGLVEISLSSGNGYYASMGKIVPITWEKGKVGNKLKLYSADGKELTLNAGTSWISVVPTTKKSSFSYR